MIKKIFRSTFFIVFIVFMLISESFATTQVLPEFMPYYNKYMTHVKEICKPNQYRHIVNLVINFGDLRKEHYAGLTSSEEFKYSYSKQIFFNVHITIDKQNWDQAPDDEKLALIYHELSHALFDYPDLKDGKYAFHFMYYTTRYVSIPESERQVVELLGIICGKK